MVGVFNFIKNHYLSRFLKLMILIRFTVIFFLVLNIVYTIPHQIDNGANESDLTELFSMAGTVVKIDYHSDKSQAIVGELII